MNRWRKASRSSEKQSSEKIAPIVRNASTETKDRPRAAVAARISGSEVDGRGRIPPGLFIGPIRIDGRAHTGRLPLRETSARSITASSHGVFADDFHARARRRKAASRAHFFDHQSRLCVTMLKADSSSRRLLTFALTLILCMQPLAARSQEPSRSSSAPNPAATPKEAAPGGENGTAADDENGPTPARPTISVRVEHTSGSELLTGNDGQELRLVTSSGGQPARLEFGSKRWQLADISYVRWLQPAARALKAKDWLLVLKGGDVVRCQVESGDGDQIKVRVAAGIHPGEMVVGLESVQAVIADEAMTGIPGRLEYAPEVRARTLRRVLGMRPGDDVALLRASVSDPASGGKLEGLVESMSPTQVTLTSDRLGKIEVEYDRLLAVVISSDPDEDAPDSPHHRLRAAGEAQLQLSDGSTLSGRLTAMGSGEVGLEHEILGDLRVDSSMINSMALFGGHLRYISDLKVSRALEFPGPFFKKSKRYAFKRDFSVFFGPLRLQNRVYRKGLGVHSFSQLDFDLEASDELFLATIGIDDSARPVDPRLAEQGVAEVVFRVKVDGEQRFEKRQSWRDEPADVEVDVRGGKKLTLEVDFGGPAGTMNSALGRANWAEARLVKAAK